MSQVKERPILFSGPMVRAILEGQKTITRRSVKMTDLLSVCLYPKEGEPKIKAAKKLCPLGRPGERLWVRETWLADAQLDSIAPRDLSQGEPIMYPADGSVRQAGCAMISQGRGRPSIHMPRWASRILLEITDIRVERLQDITEEQALVEGVLVAEHDIDPDSNGLSPVELFGGLWVMLNGMESWNANPWVWVVEFKRVMPTVLGCNYQGRHFGASYPDAQCVDGLLWNEDSCDKPGSALLQGGDIPCPKCNAEAHKSYVNEDCTQ